MINNSTIKRMMFSLLDKQDEKLTLIEKEILGNYISAYESINNQLKDIYLLYGKEIADKKFTVARLKTFKQQLQQEITQLYFKDSTVINETLRQFYRETYDQIDEMLNIYSRFGSFSEAQIKAAVENTGYNLIKWGDSEKRNIQTLIRETQTQITQGLLQGKSYLHTSSLLSNRIGVGSSRAIRIVRTESHRIQNRSKLDSWDIAKKAAIAGGFDLLKKWVHGRPRKPRDGKQDPEVNHVAMNGEYADNETAIFTLIDGTQTEAPGHTGEAKHDINCTCDMIFELK